MTPFEAFKLIIEWSLAIGGGIIVSSFIFIIAIKLLKEWL